MKEKDIKARYEDKDIFIVKWLEVTCMDGIIYLEKKRMFWSGLRFKALDLE